MKLNTSILLLILFFTLSAQSQVTSIKNSLPDTISYKNIFWNHKFNYQNKEIKFKEVSTLLKTNLEANKLLTSGKTIMAIGYVMAGTGGFIIGYNFSNEDTEMRKQNMAIGGGIIAGALIIDFLATKKIKSAIDLYNSNPSNASNHKFSVTFGINQNFNGVGFNLTF